MRLIYHLLRSILNTWEDSKFYKIGDGKLKCVNLKGTDIINFTETL